jgi:putative nucleotidyltransferase with HDIG domain
MTAESPDFRQQALSFTGNIPPFPKCVQRVMTMLRDPRIQLTKVAEVVSLDQGFAGKVLKMANSAYFGLPRRVHNVTEALVLLGFANVRNVLISASAGPILFDGVKSYGMAAGRLWEHSVASAYATQMLSRAADVRAYNMAFSAGLLHDVGKVAIDKVLDEEGSRTLLERIRSRGEAQAEREIVGVTHGEIGQMICKRWNLPPEIGDAIGHHHQPQSAECGSNLARIVAAANHCARLLLSGREAVTPADFATAPRGTFIPDRAPLKKLAEDLPGIIASSRELLQGMSEVLEAQPVPAEK